MSIQTSPRRGELYWLDWHPARGSEQAGRRPGVIVSDDGINRSASIVVVAALTSRTLRRPYTFHVRVPTTAGTGLPLESTVLCEQLMTVSKDRLLDRIGELPPALMTRVDDALRVALSLY